MTEIIKAIEAKYGEMTVWDFGSKQKGMIVFSNEKITVKIKLKNK